MKDDVDMEDMVADHEVRLMRLEMRAEFQGAALRWLAILAPIVLGTATLIVLVVK